MATWGAHPAKGQIFHCGSCCEPLVFLPHECKRIAADDAQRVQVRLQAHVRVSPACAFVAATRCPAVGCNCPKPCAVRRDDGVHCALCNGQVEWRSSRPQGTVWRSEVAAAG